MFLNAKGFDFAPHPMLVETDRDRYCIQEIVDFYARQNTDYADYFRAAWTYKHRAVFGTPNATLADIAAQQNVSAKYLTTIWKTLETKEEIGPLAKLQSMWRALPVPKAAQPVRATQIPESRGPTSPVTARIGCATSSSACGRTRHSYSAPRRSRD